jgi:hypothetical protein
MQVIRCKGYEGTEAGLDSKNPLGNAERGD